MSDKRKRNEERRKVRRQRDREPARPAPDGLRCDFCCVDRAVWAYPCADFTVAVRNGPESTLVVPYNGEWFACDICHGLIEDREWAVLAEYSVVRATDARVPFITGLDRDTAVQRIGQTQSAFRDHRRGRATRKVGA